jgi:uncharacterized RDD family membrane protein YckC
VTTAGLPETGPGSIAPAAPRLGAFLIDVLISSVVALLFTAPELPRNRSLLVFAVLYFGFTVLVGQTPGMRLLKLRVVRTTGRRRSGSGGRPSVRSGWSC